MGRTGKRVVSKFDFAQARAEAHAMSLLFWLDWGACGGARELLAFCSPIGQ